MASLRPLHIYVHWPWCKAKCPYCDFNSHAEPEGGLGPELRARYIRQVIDEIHWWRDQSLGQRSIASIFFGGGTPSLMEPAEIASIIHAIKRSAPLSPECELTLECNPTSFLEDYGQGYFQELRDVGINRVSIGVQGLRDDWLAFLGRTHHAAGARATLDAALRIFKQVNADVIYGLPGQSIKDYEELLKSLARQGLTHLAAYQLTIERNTAFWGQVRRGEWKPVSNDTEANFFEATQAVLGGFGYENYEISNFAQPESRCRHNLGVWRGEDYLGVGAGAHGRITLTGGQRIATTTRKTPEAYLAHRPGEGQHFLSFEPLNPSRAIQERLFAGLRLSEGIDITDLEKTYGAAVWGHVIDMTEFKDFSDMGWMESCITPLGTRWRVTPEGWSRLDALLGRLLKPERILGREVGVRIHSDELSA